MAAGVRAGALSVAELVADALSAAAALDPALHFVDAEAGGCRLVGVDRRLRTGVRRARDAELRLVPQVNAGLVADLHRGRQPGEGPVPGARS